MADVAVKKQSENPTSNTREVSRRSSRDPFEFSFSPFELLNSDPFTAMRRMQDEMDRTFGRFLTRGGSTESTLWSPALEVAERDGQLQIHADLPGIKPEDVKVEVAQNSLIIQGERKTENEQNQGGVYRSERHYGQFYREIPLPEGTDPEQAKAQFRDGVLQISLPLPPQKTNRRSIPIESSSGSGHSQNQAQKK